MSKYIFKISSYIQKNTQHPINALKTTIYNTKHTQNAKMHFNFSNFPPINRKLHFLFYYISNFHNSYFIFFVYSVYFKYFVYSSILYKYADLFIHSVFLVVSLVSYGYIHELYSELSRATTHAPTRRMRHDVIISVPIF